MFARRGLEKTSFAFALLVFALLALLAVLRPDSSAVAAENAKAPPQRKAAGILIDKKDDWILVKVDGEDQPVKFLIAVGADAKLAEALKALFPVSRAELTYKTDGDSRTLTGIHRQVLKPTGTVTGLVVKNYGWWVEVKPKIGVSNGYACNFPFDQNKEMMDQLKELQEGDSVTITFTTDFERHRIQSLRRNPAPAAKTASAGKRGSAGKADRAASKQGGMVAGLYIDGRGEWITVKADGEDEPVKYLIDASDKNLQAAFKSVFNACRVRVAYKNEGDARRLVGIQRQILEETGVVTGDVVKVWGNFWIEVKPKNGLADGFAPGAQYNDKAFMERLNALQPGDSVTIAFNTDFERHRIVEMRINPVKASKKGPAARSKSPAKK